MHFGHNSSLVDYHMNSMQTLQIVKEEIDLGLNLMKVVEKRMTRNCSRDDLDLAAENMCSVIELLITLTFCTLCRF